MVRLFPRLRIEQGSEFRPVLYHSYERQVPAVFGNLTLNRVEQKEVFHVFQIAQDFQSVINKGGQTQLMTYLRFLFSLNAEVHVILGYSGDLVEAIVLQPLLCLGLD